MAILDNIIVKEADLQKVMPDISNYFKFEDQSFADVIDIAKRAIYREIKEHEQNLYPGYTDAEIENRLKYVKDYENEQALKDCIVLTAIAEIMTMNQMIDQADFFLAKAKKIPLHYWIDIDSDNKVNDSENRAKRFIKFGR